MADRKVCLAGTGPYHRCWVPFRYPEKCFSRSMDNKPFVITVLYTVTGKVDQPSICVRREQRFKNYSQRVLYQ